MMQRPIPTDAFETVRAVGLTLPDVEATTKYDGSPVLKLGGSFMAGLATHPSAEPDTLVVRVDDEQREWLIEDAPETYYLTDYYRKYPLVLVRLSRIDRDALRDVLSVSWRLTAAKVRKRALQNSMHRNETPWLAGTLQDVRYGFRTLRREPGYTTLVITLMALGIAATTTLVSVTSGVLLKPLPWPEPERLVRLEERREGRSGRVPWTISNGSYLAWREGPSSTVEEIGGWSWSKARFAAQVIPNAFASPG